MERLLTKKEEEIFRLCHHDFTGLSTKEAAKILGVSPRTIIYHLRNIQTKAPQLFPIIKPELIKTWRLWIDEGLSYDEIAKRLNVSYRTVANRLLLVKRQLNYNPELHKRGQKPISIDSDNAEQHGNIGIDETKIKHRF